MQNATEMWRKIGLSNKFSPGNFVRRKEVKSILGEEDWKKEDSEFYFSDMAYNLYLDWAAQEDEKKEPKEEIVKSEVNDLFLMMCDKIGETNAIEYANKLLKWFIVDKSYHTLSIEFKTKHPLKYATGNLEKCIKIYFQVIMAHVDLSGQLHRNEIRNLCQDLHKTFNSLWVSNFHDNKCFKIGNELYVAGNTNRLKKVIVG
jgi:hypothetical protein